MVDQAMRRVIKLFGEAREQVLVVSAYIRSDMLHQLLDAVPDNVAVTVYTRWHIDDILTGASDRKAWDVAKNHGTRFYSCPRLHAKMYIADNAALVGSANATNKGLRGSESSNIELLLPVDATQKDITATLNTILAESFLAAPFGIDVRERGRIEDEVIAPCVWTPSTDFELFIDMTQGRAPHTEGSMNDCRSLCLHEKADRKAIQAAVRDTTVFRLIEEKFKNWPGTMDTSDLRKLFSDTGLSSLDTIPDEQLLQLMAWVGQLGKNTYLLAGSANNMPTLNSGVLLSSHVERS